MLAWLADYAARIKLAELADENVRLKIAYDQKCLECDLLGELYETYRRRVQIILADLVQQGRMLGIKDNGTDLKIPEQLMKGT